MTAAAGPQVMSTASGQGALRLLRFLRLRAEHLQSINRRNRSSRKVVVVGLNDLLRNRQPPRKASFVP